jgi:hypothetical protein
MSRAFYGKLWIVCKHFVEEDRLASNGKRDGLRPVAKGRATACFLFFFSFSGRGVWQCIFGAILLPNEEKTEGCAMIRGAQKQMLVIRTGDSRYFDEAYFILRRELPRGDGGRGDMLREANRILEESGVERTVCRRRRGWMVFGIGLLCGAVVAVMLCLWLL